MNKSWVFLLAAALLLIAIAFNPLGTKATPMKPPPIDRELMQKLDRMEGMEEIMDRLVKDNEALKAENSDIQDEVNYLNAEYENLQSEYAELMNVNPTVPPKEITETSSENSADITIMKFWRYTECEIYGEENFCTKLDVLLENEGTNTIYFDPHYDTWLMDNSLAQYNPVRTGTDIELRSGQIYSGTLKRGYIYYYPAVPSSSKNITFYAGIDGKGVKEVLSPW